MLIPYLVSYPNMIFDFKQNLTKMLAIVSIFKACEAQKIAFELPLCRHQFLNPITFHCKVSIIIVGLPSITCKINFAHYGGALERMRDITRSSKLRYTYIEPCLQFLEMIPKHLLDCGLSAFLIRDLLTICSMWCNIDHFLEFGMFEGLYGLQSLWLLKLKLDSQKINLLGLLQPAIQWWPCKRACLCISQPAHWVSSLWDHSLRCMLLFPLLPCTSWCCWAVLTQNCFSVPIYDISPDNAEIPVKSY